MLGSLVVALTVVPVLASILLKGRISEEDTRLLRALKAVYHPVLLRAIRHRIAVVLIRLAALLGSLATLPFLCTAVVPEPSEGTISIPEPLHPRIELAVARPIAPASDKTRQRHE